MKKRRLSILLSIVMLLSLLPTTALAAAYADVEVNGVTLSDGKYLASNSTKTANNSSTEPATYVAWYKDGVLTLNDYDGKYIQVNGALKSDLTVKLKGSNTITSSYSRGGIFQNGAGGSITVTAADSSSGKLTINATSSNSIAGINNSFVAGHTLGDVTIKGHADVRIITTADSVTGQAYGIYGKSVSILENASVNITSNTPNRTSGSLCHGIYAKEDAKIDTAGKIKIDVTNAGTGNAHSYGINVMGRSLTLTRAAEMVVEWRKSTAGSTGGAPYYPITASFSDTDHAINVDTTNCFASYRKGTPYTVRVENGTLTCDGVVPKLKESGNFLAGDKVKIEPNEKKSSDGTLIPFKEWTAVGVAIDSPATENNSFIVPNKDVTVTAMHNPFYETPVFKSTSDARGTIEVKTVAKLDNSEIFQYVKDGETAYQRPYFEPSTTSTESPYQYIFDVTTYNSGDIRYLEAGDYRMVVTLNGEEYLSEKFTVSYAAAAKTLSSIAVTTAPTKTTYTAGENFDPAGMVVTATYSDSSTAAVTGYTVTDGNSLTAGTTSVTISYTEGGLTKTCTQAITVNAAPKTLSSIAVTTEPTKTTYTAGENFDPAGMVVTATYSDSSTAAVTSYTVTDGNNLTAGKSTVTISYTEGGLTKTCTQAITVNAAPTEYTITFNGNGGTPSEGTMTTVGSKLTSLPTATHSGSYSFVGWYTAASGGTQITTAYEFSADTTVYAHWTYTGGGSFGGYVPTVQKPEITIIGSGKADLSADGRTATITAAAGHELVSVVLNGKEMGKVEKLTGLKTGDKATITFQAKTDGKAEMDKMIAQKASKLTLMARSKKTAKLNIKVVVKGDLKAITDAGYTVKYKFYRSTKKSAGYKAVLTKKAPTYFNTYGKKGTMYYYKARVMIYDKDGNFVAQTALKQCKYANRLWTK